MACSPSCYRPASLPYHHRAGGDCVRRWKASKRARIFGNPPVEDLVEEGLPGGVRVLICRSNKVDHRLLQQVERLLLLGEAQCRVVEYPVADGAQKGL